MIGLSAEESTGDAMLSFHDLEQKFGSAAAYQYLMEIEKASHIRSSDVVDLDPEARLALACQMQDSLTAHTHLAA